MIQLASIDSDALDRGLATYDTLYLHHFVFVERMVNSLHLFQIALLIGYAIFFCRLDETEVSDDAFTVVVVFEQKS